LRSCHAKVNVVTLFCGSILISGYNNSMVEVEPAG